VNRAQVAASGGADDFSLAKKILLGVLLALVAMCLISVPMLRYGSVSGEEFSPGRFQRRSYHYWEIPLVHIQITPLQKQDETNDLENYLVQQKLILPANESRPRWDGVRLRRADFEASPGDALILCRYLDQQDADGGLIWLNWSKQEPELAKVFWPVVADLARSKLYILAPEFFHMAQTASSPQALRNDMAERMARECEQFARVEEQLGNAPKAAEWFAAALRYDPRSAAAAEGRERALRASPNEPAHDQPAS
jgi:hypothetical protein